MVRIGAVLLAVSLVVGCSAAGSGTEGAVDESLRVPPGSQPFAIFLDRELASVEYALGVYSAQCMEDRGFPQLASRAQPKRESIYTNQLILNERSFGPVSVEEATQYGYGRSTEVAGEAPTQFISDDPSYPIALEECHGQSWEALGRDDNAIYLAYFQLGNQLSVEATLRRAQGQGRDTFRALLRCLDEKGHAVRDEDAFLNGLDLSLFGIELGNVVDGAYVPSPDEVALAKADVECRLKLDTNEQLLEHGIAVQADLVADHEAEFLELNPKMTELATRAAELTAR